MEKRLVKITAVRLTFFVALSAALLLALLAGCDGNGPADVDPADFVAVTNITGVARETTEGVDLPLSGVVIPATATNKTVTWSVKSAGGTGAKITENTLSANKPGTVTVTARIAKGKSSKSDYAKDFSITILAVNALAASFEVVTTGGLDSNLIMGNSLAWIKDAKEGSKLVFYMSTTVYPTGAEYEQFKPKAGDTIAIIGNSANGVADVVVKIPANTPIGAGRQIALEIPLEQALALIGDATSLKVDLKYGKINACQLLEPRRYKAPHSPNARRMMNYFRDIYGEKMISGMMDQSWQDSADSENQIMIVKNATGKYPALKGFDHIQHRDNSLPIRQQAEEALYWWNGYDRQGDGSNKQWVKVAPDGTHGIVCYCWHWRGPDNGFYGTEEAATGNNTPTTFRIPMENGKLNKAHANFAYIKQEVDKVIAEFKWINAQAGTDVPIIWRPMHEAGGNWGRGPWFWWGMQATDNSSGNEAFKALWEYLYDYMTIVNGLDNLIWLCNPQGDLQNTWVPDLRTVDLTGYDPYVGDNESQAYYYNGCKAMDPSGNTMVAMSENGKIPDPDKCVTDNALWLFFMIWNGMATSADKGTGENSYYQHPLVVTLETLPNITTYRLE